MHLSRACAVHGCRPPGLAGVVEHVQEGNDVSQLMIWRVAISSREEFHLLVQPADSERAGGRRAVGKGRPHPFYSSRSRILSIVHVADMLRGAAESQRQPLKHNKNTCNTRDMKTVPFGTVENARQADEIRVLSVAGGLGFEPRLTE